MSIYTNTLQPLADKAAIGVSLLCALHCLALPVGTTLLPSLFGLSLEDESFHLWLVAVVIPLSAFALTLGCARHHRVSVLFTGLFGLWVLCMSSLGHGLLSETSERVLTLTGSLFVVVSHVVNFRLCRQASACECPERE